MSYIERPGKPVFRHGKRIETIEIVPSSLLQQKRRRKAFEAQFVRVPKGWVAALSQTKSVSTYQLALVILDKEFERQQTGKEIVLSGQVTRMSQTTRRRATQELVSLGLIQLKPGNGRDAPKVLTVRGSLRAPRTAT
jgi:Fic family protein